jgi:hypothetical protein
MVTDYDNMVALQEHPDFVATSIWLILYNQYSKEIT